MALWRLKRSARAASLLILLPLFSFASLFGGAAQAADSLYEVAKLSVDTTAEDAVAARAMGMAEAEMRAVKIVLQRLVPLSAQELLPELSQEDVEAMVNGVSIRKEENSTTRYIATLDVSVNEQGIKQLLQDQGIPYGEERAPPISILPLVIAGGSVTGEGGDVWRQAWEDLDLSHSMTPATILRPRPDLGLETVKAVLAGDAQALESMQGGLRLWAAGHRRGRDRGRGVRHPAGRCRQRGRHQFRAERHAWRRCQGCRAECGRNRLCDHREPLEGHPIRGGANHRGQI